MIVSRFQIHVMKSLGFIAILPIAEVMALPKSQIQKILSLKTLTTVESDPDYVNCAKVEI